MKRLINNNKVVEDSITANDSERQLIDLNNYCINLMACENLYNSLAYNLPDSDLANSEKQDLTEIIARLLADQKEQIYLLILHDYTKYNPHTKVIFPYKTKQVATDKLEIKVDALPIRLKRILYKFCKLAENTVSEDEELPT